VRWPCPEDLRCERAMELRRELSLRLSCRRMLRSVRARQQAVSGQRRADVQLEWAVGRIGWMPDAGARLRGRAVRGGQRPELHRSRRDLRFGWQVELLLDERRSRGVVLPRL